jgi:hypothetical protein
MEARLEPLRSNFDTTLGGVFYNVRSVAIPEVAAILAEARDRRRESDEKRQEFLDKVMSWVAVRHYPLVAHEWGHSLQAITHPALYLRCLREFSAIATVLAVLRETPTPVPVPFIPSEPWGTELILPTHRVRISISDEGMPELEDPGEDWPQWNDVSEVDLLEDSALIFQYKAEIGSHGQVGGYRRWLQQSQGRSARVFNFLTKYMPAADAYVALPPLVMAANLTNWPVHSFVCLLSMMVREKVGAPSEMGVDIYWRYLENGVRSSYPKGERPDPRRLLEQEGEPRRIDRDGMLSLASEISLNPLSPVIQKAWQEEGQIERLRHGMLNPFEVFEREHRAPAEWVTPFGPPLVGVRVMGEIEIGIMPIEISPTVIEHGALPSEQAWKEHIVELMRVKAFVFSAATPLLRSLPHNCPHSDCEFHPLGMCRGWVNIPEDFRDCNFPEWLRRVAFRQFHDGALVHVGEEEEGSFG